MPTRECDDRKAQRSGLLLSQGLLAAAAAAPRLIGRDVRLVTLAGSAGVGKTRLALATAATVVDRFVDGAVLVGHAAIR